MAEYENAHHIRNEKGRGNTKLHWNASDESRKVHWNASDESRKVPRNVSDENRKAQGPYRYL